MPDELTERQMMPNVGGGVDVDKLKSTDFVMPSGRKFPVMTPADVSDAVASFGRAKGVDFETFKRNLIALCRRKGEAFMKALPAEWKADMMDESDMTEPQGIQLSEALDLSEAQVDSEARVIHNVVLIRAGLSKNRREYPAHVLEGAVKVFEGTKAYADHPNTPNRPRNVRDTTGWYENVRYEDGALKATRHFTPNAAGLDVWLLAEMIAKKQAPATLAGLSINAVGTGKSKRTDTGDIVVVESITGADSVDDVSAPSAGGSYHESTDSTLFEAYLKVLSYEQWLEARPEFVDKLKREWKAVRLEDETKRALAESDLKVKAAEARAGELETALQTARTEIATLTEARDAALAEVQRETRSRLVTETLTAVKLPASWKDELRGRLMETAPDTWAGIIEAEINKAKHTGALPKVPVTGTQYQENRAPAASAGGVSANALAPRDGETFPEWQARLKRLNVRGVN